MLRSQFGNPGWRLYLDDDVLLRHSPQQPFAVMIRQEKRYTAKRGTVKTTAAETERVPLTEAERVDEDTVRFHGGSHTLTLRIAPCEGGAEHKAIKRVSLTHARDDRAGFSMRAGKGDFHTRL